MNKYNIQFSDEIKNKYNIADYSDIISESSLQEYLQQLRYELHSFYNVDDQLLCGNNINITEAE